MNLLILTALVGFRVCFATIKTDTNVTNANEKFRLDRSLSDDDDSDEERKSMLTYNIGMTYFVPNYPERQNILPDLFANVDADVVCLQEAWAIKDVKTVLDNTRSSFPYSYSLVHESLTTIDETNAQMAPCDDAQALGADLGCAVSLCSAFTGIALLVCALSTPCGLLTFSQDCISCLSFTAGDFSVIPQCATPSFRMNILGLLVLSKTKPISYEVHRFEPDPENPLLIPRGYIQLKYEDFGKVICTHLTANLGPDYFESLPYTSFQEQQEAEINQLLGLTQMDDDWTILGDLNCGPSVPEQNIIEEFLENYQMLKDSGFISAYEEDVGNCTFCESNTLVLAEQNFLIDHVMTRGRMRGSNAKRLFDENIIGKSFPPSDHFGVQVDVRRVDDPIDSEETTSNDTNSDDY